MDSPPTTQEVFPESKVRSATRSVVAQALWSSFHNGEIQFLDSNACSQCIDDATDRIMDTIKPTVPASGSGPLKMLDISSLDRAVALAYVVSHQIIVEKPHPRYVLPPVQRRIFGRLNK